MFEYIIIGGGGGCCGGGCEDEGWGRFQGDEMEAFFLICGYHGLEFRERHFGRAESVPGELWWESVISEVHGNKQRDRI